MGQSPQGDSVNSTIGIEFHQGKLSFTDKYLQHSNKYTSAPTKVVDAQTILVCVRAPVGDVNITPRKICIGRGLCGIVPLNCNLMYCFYLLQSLKQSFESKATGTTFRAISGEIIKEERILLPPIAEQTRIANYITNIYNQLDTIAENL